jgi:uncharacterized membrane protein (Fun14 family)
VLEQLVPGLGALGLGGLLGYAVGIAFRSAAKTLGCLLGVLFILLQVLAYYHVVHLDWAAIVHQAQPAGHMAETALEKFWRILTYNIPFGGGFAVGAVWALRRH